MRFEAEQTVEGGRYKKCLAQVGLWRCKSLREERDCSRDSLRAMQFLKKRQHEAQVIGLHRKLVQTAVAATEEGDRSNSPAAKRNLATSVGEWSAVCPSADWDQALQLTVQTGDSLSRRSKDMFHFEFVCPGFLADGLQRHCEKGATAASIAMLCKTAGELKPPSCWTLFKFPSPGGSSECIGVHGGIGSQRWINGFIATD